MPSDAATTQAHARRYRLTLARRASNWLMKGLLRTRLAPRHTYLLEVRGRRTGRRYTTPVRLVEDDGSRWLVAPYGERSWVKNARASGVVELRRGHRHEQEQLAIRELEPDESAPILQRYVREVPITRPFFTADPADDVAAFRAEAALHPVFALASSNGTERS